jgi:starch synthase (maltosyl-transferring)
VKARQQVQGSDNQQYYMIYEGRKRVIITNVLPQPSCEAYTAKGALGGPFTIAADIFTDGHDQIAASVHIKAAEKEDWLELPMKQGLNDRWTADFFAPYSGQYIYRIDAWVDHFTTWSMGLKKKYAAGQDISVELRIGAQMLENALGKAPVANDREQLMEYVTQWKDASKVTKNFTAATSNTLAAIMYKYRDPALVTTCLAENVFEIERKQAAYSTWYELFPRSTSAVPGRHGTFKDVIGLLPRIAKMGFDILYLPPIHPIGEKNRKGKNNSLTPGLDEPGSPWAIGNSKGGHKSIHPALGDLTDFKKLVKEARRRGMEIAMDIAYQCAPDHPYVKQHPQWFKWRPDGTVQYAENPPKRYEDILPFDFETEDWENLWLELKSVIDYWISAGVTIFRIDNPHTKSFRFWAWLIAEVRNAHPEIIFLAEAFTRPRVMEQLAKAGFNQSYSYFTWRNDKKELEEYMTTLTKTEMRYYFRPNFWPNTPDILPPALISGGENAHIMRLILAATLSSNYGLYGPIYEFGINQPHGNKEEYIDNEKYEIRHWDWQAYTRIGEIITRVNRIRQQNPALQSTWNIEFAETSNDQIICYTKHDTITGNLIIVVVNLNVSQTEGAHVHIPFEKLGIDRSQHVLLHDLLSGEKYRWQDEWNYVELNPYHMPAHILQVVQQN